MNNWKYVDLAQGIPQGDILHSPNTVNGPTINDLLYRQRPEDTTGGTSSKSYGEYNPPHGEVGWICPVCGRGLAPSTSYCPCNLTRNITYLNGGVSIQDYANTNTTPPEAYYTTTATTTPNGEDWIKADAKLHCPSGALNF